MDEEESEISKNMVLGNRYEVKNPEGDVIVRHEIFGIGPTPFLSLFGEKGKELAKQNYRMFGAIMGYPDTSAVYNIPKEFKNDNNNKSSEERFNIYFSSFKEFSDGYFNGNNGRRPFLVYLHDFSFDSWNKDNVERLVKSLRENGVCVSKKIDGEIDIDGQKIYHTVLLFERDKDIVLD